MDELSARLKLFANIDPGNEKWLRQIYEQGPIQIMESIEDYADAALANKIIKTDPNELLEKLAKLGMQFIYPDLELFAELKNPPIGLVAKGNVELIGKASISIVGSRNATNYGIRIAQELASNFVDREWCVVSGGAYGIDTAAHRGALVSEGETIAVLACGLDVVYPAGNQRLFEEIAETGLLISEYLPGTKALQHRFLNRNRLIAALSKGTIVVEAAFRSGALRTAYDAHDLRRCVMAIPGPITSPLSEGCHRLIGMHVAEICTGVSDAIEVMG